MDEKYTMENLLLTAKGACDLYLHGTIEASTPNVHQVFSTALTQTLKAQEAIYKQMEQKGWYVSTQVPKQKTDLVKSKFTAEMQN